METFSPRVREGGFSGEREREGEKPTTPNFLYLAAGGNVLHTSRRLFDSLRSLTDETAGEFNTACECVRARSLSFTIMAKNTAEAPVCAAQTSGGPTGEESFQSPGIQEKDESLAHTITVKMTAEVSPRSLRRAKFHCFFLSGDGAVRLLSKNTLLPHILS